VIETPTDDRPGFVAEEPDHCHDCYRLIRPGETHYLTIKQVVVCPECRRAANAIRLAAGLTVGAGWTDDWCSFDRAPVAALLREVPNFTCLLSRPSSASEADIGWPRQGALFQSHRCPPSQPFDALRTGDRAGQLQDAVIGARTPRPVGQDRHLDLLQVQVCPRWTSALCRQSAGVATNGSPACWGARVRPQRAPGWPPRARPGVRPTVFRPAAEPASTRGTSMRFACRCGPGGGRRSVSGSG
jgi:hypothetical protein